MKIVHLSTHDVGDGASIAAWRIHQSLRAAGADSHMLVKQKRSGAESVQSIQALSTPVSRAKRVLIRSLRRREQANVKDGIFTGYRSEFSTELFNQIPNADIYNLHWVAGFVDPQRFLPFAARRAPVVWRLADMQPYTGGCHYDEGCGQFENRCGHCPRLRRARANDLSRTTLTRNLNAFREIPSERLHIVCPSDWAREQSQRSSLFSRFSHTVIPNPLDVEMFRPLNKEFARQALGIPSNKFVMLFVAHRLNNPHKGFADISQVIANIEGHDDIVLLTVGKDHPVVPDSVHHESIGYVGNPHLMPVIYNAADAFVMPSLHESFGQTAVEAMACGVPVVGYRTGGIQNTVRQGKTGFLVDPGDRQALGRTLQLIKINKDKLKQLSLNCRMLCEEEFSMKSVAERYLTLYGGIISP